MAATTPEDPHMEADVLDDNDSAHGSELESSTASLASEITRYEFENGRRYHSYRSGQYAFPNDENELDRMDLENHLFFLLLDNKLHLAPLQSPQRILDLGTGTGIWPIWVADQYPSAEVIGTDLSPVQPKWVPPNLQFLIEDFSHEWTFQESSFDLIHWRLLLASIPDYHQFFQQAFRFTKPNGYLEIHEIDPSFYCDDDTLPENSSARLWGDLFLEACAKLGRPIPAVNAYKKWMEEAGFVDIEEKILKRPSNTWPKDSRLKEIGKFTFANHIQGLHAFTIGPFTRALGYTPLEVEVLVAKVKSEWKTKAIHGYQKVVVVYGRKPKV